MITEIVFGAGLVVAQVAAWNMDESLANRAWASAGVCLSFAFFAAFFGDVGGRGRM